MQPLFILYLDGQPTGVATGPDGETILLNMRAALLGQTKKTGPQPAMTTKPWNDAPVEDCVRAGLGTLLSMTFAMMPQRGPKLA